MPEDIDPVTYEILKNVFRNICDQGSATIERVAYGPIITEGHDYSVSLLTPDGRLIAHGSRDQTPHIGTFEATIEEVNEHTSDLEPGDVYVLNMPYEAGTHTPDVRLVRGIFVDGEQIATTITLTHWADIGGPVPGTFNPDATEVYAEGLYLTPLKLYEDDELVESTWTLIKNNIRLPEVTKGDLTAQYEATRTMEARLQDACEKYGTDTVQQVFEAVMDRSERRFREGIADLPDGTYRFEDYVDRDHLDPDSPRVGVRCELTVDGDRVTVDWTDSDPAPTAPIGTPLPATVSATMDGILHYFPDLVPLNNGIIRSVDIETEPDTAVHVTRPTPVSGGNAAVYEKVSAAVMGSLAQPFAEVDPERISAGTVNLQNAVVGGVHPETGNEFVSYTWLEGGQGARYDMDGPNFMMMTYAAGASNQSIEVQERWYPFLYTSCEGVQDSCGDGEYRGGIGISRNYRLRGEGRLSVHGDREEVTPYGLAGGTNGGPNRLVVNEGTDDERDVGMVATDIPVEEGDHVTFHSNGGGGFGDPLERDPERVLEDVVDEYISLEKAEEVYGVVIEVNDRERLDYEIDREATRRKRAELEDVADTEGFGPHEVHPFGKRLSDYLYLGDN